jgi:CO/xanthine dehydrogenase Mo-binding subunit
MGTERHVIGKPLRFKGGESKVTGKANYLDDLELPGMLHAKILRSPHAHAQILSIDASMAQALPGVKAVLTAADCPATKFGLDIADATILARGKVRYAGEEVAGVAAESIAIAERAIDLIKVEYALLPSIMSADEALREDAVLIHDDKPKNIAAFYDIERGDYPQVIESCDYVFEEEFSTSRVLPCYLEPFGVIAEWTPQGRLEINTGIQAIFQARSELARALDMQPSEIIVKAPTIGGAFGGKIWIRNFHPIAALLAKKARRPVKYIMTREEEFAASRPRVPARIKIKLGFLKDGTMLCKEMDIVADNGAYSWAAPKITLNMSMRTDCLYRFMATRVRSRLAYTNTTPTSGFRGYGNGQAHFALESMIDICSRKMGIDPVEVRLKNASRQGDTTLHGWQLRSCGLSECIEKARAGILDGRLPRLSEDGRLRRGIGIACMNHVSGNRGSTNFDGSSSMMRFQEDGKLCLSHGESDMGQGASTVLSQIAAETIGISADDVIVMPLCTDSSPFCFGSYSSRVTTVAGKAAKLAASQLRTQLLNLAAEVLQESPGNLEITKGLIYKKGDSTKSLSVKKACQLGIRSQKTVPLTVYIAYDPPTTGADPKTFYGDYSSAYTYAAQAVEVEVDTETGQVRILRVIAAHDIGYAINPLGVKGQIYGGIAQGGGWAIYENIVYENGQLKTNSLRHYNMMTMSDMPEVKSILVETNDPIGPYGAKGVGEPTLIPMPPAIANAVHDAIGVRIRDLPISAEKVFFALYPECEGGDL